MDECVNVFCEDAKLYIALNNFIHELIFNKYTQKLFEPELLNKLNREELSEKFTVSYMNEYKDEITSHDKIDNLISFVAKEIDRLIPKIYFIEINNEMCNKYSYIFVRRIYDTEGKDGFDIVDRFEYAYEHDFSEERKYIKETMASEKQVSYLKNLGKKMGYLLWHENYLSKTYANQMIEYLSEKSSVEPVIFSFFFVSK